MSERDPEYVLEGVEVERVDAVSRPATGRRWLLLKAEDIGKEERMEELKEVGAGALAHLAEQLARAEYQATAEALAALRTLAQALGMDPSVLDGIQPVEPVAEAVAAEEPVPVEASAEERADEAPSQQPEESEKEVATEGYGYPLPALSGAILDELKAIRELLATLVEHMAKSERVEKAAPPPSRQPAAVEPVRPRTPRLGEGLFVDVVYGR